MTVPVLEARELHKSYRGGDGSAVNVLSGASLTVSGGEMVAVVGESGAGKSTLLHLVGALERPDSGAVILGGEPLDAHSDDSLARLRNRTVGFVFQFHHLLREFSALENVLIPLRIGGMEPAAARERARELLARVGLGGRMHHRPGQLSGGEQQRTAVARALAARPAVVLADEPSGNLDAANGARLHELLAEVSREAGVGMVVATHNRALASLAQRVYLLEGGRLHETSPEGVVW